MRQNSLDESSLGNSVSFKRIVHKDFETAVQSSMSLLTDTGSLICICWNIWPNMVKLPNWQSAFEAYAASFSTSHLNSVSFCVDKHFMFVVRLKCLYDHFTFYAPKFVKLKSIPCLISYYHACDSSHLIFLVLITIEYLHYMLQIDMNILNV